MICQRTSRANYQETGRAGRDGLPSECVLLFSAGDAIKQRRFIDEKPDPKERTIASEQLEQMVHYAEDRQLPPARIASLFFGEMFRRRRTWWMRQLPFPAAKP